MIPTIWWSDRCIVCEHHVSARSADALGAAIREHVRFINATKDHPTNDHFIEARLNRLVDA